MLLVRATERSIRQTESFDESQRRCGVVRLFIILFRELEIFWKKMR